MATPGAGRSVDIFHDVHRGVIPDRDPESAFLEHGDHAEIVRGGLRNDALKIPFGRNLETIVGEGAPQLLPTGTLGGFRTASPQIHAILTPSAQKQLLIYFKLP
jgi:hypothetical protein